MHPFNRNPNTNSYNESYDIIIKLYEKRFNGLPEDNFNTAVTWLFQDSDRKAFFVKSLNESHRNNRKLIDHISSLLQINDWEGKLVADLGCGSGGGCVAFAEKGAKVIGIEASPGWLKLAELRLKKYTILKDKIDLQQGNVLEVDIDDNSIDFCFADQLLEHIVDKERLLKEIIRILRPGAFAFIGFPNRLAIREHHTHNLLFASYIPKTMSDRYLVMRKKLKSDLTPRPDFLPWPWTIDKLCSHAGLQIKHYTYKKNTHKISSKIGHMLDLIFKIKGFSLIVMKPEKSSRI